MKLGITAKVKVIGKESRDYKKQDGSAGKSFSLAVLQDGTCGNLSCTEELFNLITPDFNVDVVLGAVYDDNYRTFKFDAFCGDVKPSK